MSADEPTHRLAAIISGDVAGYSRMIAANEALTVRLINAYREEIDLLIRQHSGRLVDFTGDNFLAEFSSSLAAVRCAVDIQNVLRARNRNLDAGRRMEFRIGVNQGEIRTEGERIFGTGVNVAARLCALAEPGRICVSSAVYEQLRGNLEIECEALGERTVKNIPNPVHVYRLGIGADGAGLAETAKPRRFWIPAAAVAVAGAAAGVAFFFLRGDLEPQTGRGMDAAAVPASVSANAPSEQLSKPSIVVLPFQNMSQDPEQEFFADGIAEDLTTDLSRIRELFVISRNSALVYKGKAIDVAEVGRALGVRYVLEGSVRKVGTTVRITAQLIDASTNFHLWSNRYDRELKDIFAVQSEITSEILSALKLEIEDAELARISRAPIEHLNAYEARLRGRTLARGFRRELVARGRSLLERAIELDPNDAEAYGDLANSYMVEFAGWNHDPSLIERAMPLARRGLQLDARSPASHLALAAVEVASGRTAEGLAFARRALFLAPSSADAQVVVGILQLQLGRLEEGTRSLDVAIRLNPHTVDYTWTLLGLAYARSGEVEKALPLWQRVVASNADAIPDRTLLASFSMEGGAPAEAVEQVAEGLRAAGLPWGQFG